MAGLFSKKTAPPARRRISPQEERRTEQATSDELDQRYNFRRNRTLTGSSSSQVTSAGETNAQLKSPRVRAHELIKKRRRLGLLLAMLGVGVIGIYLLILQFTASAVVSAVGISVQLDQQYEKVVQDYLATRPVERLRFLMNRESLNSYVKAELPEIASIDVGDHGGFGKTVFNITVREPLVGWSIQGKQQYVDASGTAFTHNYYPAPSVQIVDNSGIRPENGQIASNRFLGFVGRAVGLAEVQGYKVVQVAIPAATTKQVELRIEGLSYPVKLSVDRGAGEQIEDMARSIRWFQQHGQSPQYVDVRVSGKVFYR